MNLEFLYVIAALIIVITIHECSHAGVAYLLGDPTAKMEKRLSLNPLRHLDPIGTLMMFIVHIGWGKPVPVNPRFFKHPKRDEALTALAGPLSNLILAALLALPIKYLRLFMPMPLEYFFNLLIDVSIWLFAFNMLPFPPLDGSKIIQLAIPRKYERVYTRYLNGGVLYFMLFLLFDQFFLSRILGMSLLSQFLGIIFTFIKSLIFLGT
jgi:Zn-dependent protease